MIKAMKVITLMLILIVLISCKSSKQAGCDAYSKVENSKK
jgi:hypothetical protein